MEQRTGHISPADLARQRDYTEQIAAVLRERDVPPLAFVDTYGCQQNEADSEHLRGMLREMGYGFTDEEAEADLILINTCAIREHAEHRVLGNVGALVHTKRAKPSQIICLCGCMMQQQQVAQKIRSSFHHVDMVFGTHALWRFPELLWRVMSRRTRVFELTDEPGSIAEGLPVARMDRVKAWVSVMYGCNNFCSYCIVPYVRGRERSREPEQILREVRELVESGYKDITLLGQNVNSYGRGLDRPIDFSDLLREIDRIPGKYRIRFMTSHPKDASPRLFETMAACSHVAPHIHLPFQSGNDRVLRAMNRGYTRAGYLALVEAARANIPDLVLTSDVIVGFPGETTPEFEDTLSLIEEVRFDALFTFIYSPRPGTVAARLPDPMTRAEKQVNFDRLVAVQNDISAEKHRAYLGKTVEVLVDGLSTDPRNNLNARTPGGRLVHLSGPASLVGTFIPVRITGAATWALTGELAAE
ncbi:MAG: tRNA (N6-isopentenyl adenosine(37)-C2)-methylthiotransferase MiaB [Oscillospiraceae bacterium]|nr:tRNA (N6-isopentenyl adenosine(37)-C2)-methylthiotransferase MiaB [Oscillospiraceae bacterium]